MFKLDSKSYDIIKKAEYILYENKKIVITKHYNKYARHKYFEDIWGCFWMLLCGIGMILIFPISLILKLIDFIPKIYIKDDE